VLDVRSPGEYDHGHIPGAFSLPLFSDEERAVVGTAYKQQGREPAIKIGLDYFGPKMRSMVEYVETLFTSGAKDAGARQVLIHCWRGGMRSAGVAWLLDMYGFKVCTLAGGYKSYRHWIIETFSFPLSFNILGGYTGSGKTLVLEEMKKEGVATINLEKLASHKGSAFGNIGMPKQPSQEMFENYLGHELRTHSQGDLALDRETSPGNSIWLEDESQRIGHINIPHELWKNMFDSPIIFIDIPFEERLKQIVQEYGSLDKERVGDAIVRIQKRLGGLETKMALQNLATGDIESCFRILLKYYDKLYRKALENRDQTKIQLTKLDCSIVDARVIANKILINEPLLK